MNLPDKTIASDIIQLRTCYKPIFVNPQFLFVKIVAKVSLLDRRRDKRI